MIRFMQRLFRRKPKKQYILPAEPLSVRMWDPEVFFNAKPIDWNSLKKPRPAWQNDVWLGK